jgi:hypothetical protein
MAYNPWLDGLVTRTTISGDDGAGTYRAVQVDALGALKTTAEISGPLNTDGEVKVNSDQLNNILETLLTVTSGLASVFNGQPNNFGRLRVHAEGVDNVSYIQNFGYPIASPNVSPANQVGYDTANMVAGIQRQFILTD